jgi:hypothetical protein
MQHPAKRLRPRPPQLPFLREADQPNLWAGLSPEQQQTCQQLLGQLLYSIGHREREDCKNQPKE